MARPRRVILGVALKMTVLLALLAASAPVQAAFIWPATNNDWHAIMSGTGYMPDPDNDFTGASGLPYLDIEGDTTTHAAGYWYLDTSGTGTVTDDTLMFRMRIDGNAATYAYQFSFDTNSSPSSIDWALQYDAVEDHVVELVRATTTGPTYGDVRFANTSVWSGSFTTYARRFVPTGDGSNFGGNPDYFIDVAVPWTNWALATGMTQQSPWRVQLSTATEHNALNMDFPQGWSGSTTVGSGFSNPTQTNPVPEPGTLLLMSLSVGALIIKRHKLRAKQGDPA
jgi:hypothetical protein